MNIQNCIVRFHEEAKDNSSLVLDYKFISNRIAPHEEVPFKVDVTDTKFTIFAISDSERVMECSFDFYLPYPKRSIGFLNVTFKEQFLVIQKGAEIEIKNMSLISQEIISLVKINFENVKFTNLTVFTNNQAVVYL